MGCLPRYFFAETDKTSPDACNSSFVCSGRRPNVKIYIASKVEAKAYRCLNARYDLND